MGAPTPAKLAQHFPSDPNESLLLGQGPIVNFEEDGIGHPSTQLVTEFPLLVICWQICELQGAKVHFSQLISWV